MVTSTCMYSFLKGGGGEFGGSRGFHGFQGGKRRESVEYKGDTIEN